MSTQTDVAQQILDAFNFRHACKVFDPERKIPEEQFRVILEAARLSPSSFGFEPWQILIVQSPEKRELFRDYAWGANGAFNGTRGQLGTASHFIIMLAHTDVTMKHHSEYLQTHMREVKKLPEEVIGFINQAYEKFQNHDFHIESRRQVVDWAGKQAYIALANMMTTAALMGIDSCPIEGFDMDKVSEILETHFGIDPERYQPAVMLALGYRAGDPPFEKTRRPMDKIVSRF